jgi:uncharacterized membrane protein YdbT with pleckstrin-like domain
MSYIENNLLLSERILYRTQAHWIVFLFPLGWSLLSLYFLSIVVNPVITLCGYLLGIAALFTWSQAIAIYASSEFGLTDKRVIIKVGLIRRNTLETLLQKVESLQVSQSILGRLFNFGTITVCGTGGSRDVFRNIDDPLAFRRAVQEQIHQVLTKGQ